MKSEMNYSIVIPVYNEENSILNVIDSIKNYDSACDLVIVDDGSTDKTVDLLADIDWINLVRHKRNLGYGAALKSGINHAKNEIVVTMDADGEHQIEDMKNLLGSIEDYDMVIGARIGPNSKIPFQRLPAKWILNKIANYLTGFKIPDLNSGFRVVRKKHVKKYESLLPSGFSFSTTITMAMLMDEYQVKYLPINYKKRKGPSKIHPIKDTINILNTILRIIVYFDPMKIFTPLSLIFLLSGFCFLSYDIYQFNITQSSLFFLFYGLLILSIGVLADLINKKSTLD